jgi:hypothetical protein
MDERRLHEQVVEDLSQMMRRCAAERQQVEARVQPLLDSVDAYAQDHRRQLEERGY